MPGLTYSCGIGLFSAGTIGARSFWRGRASSSSLGGDIAARGTGCGLVERQAGGQAPDLLGVEHFAREQRVGDLHQRLLVRRQQLVRALVVVVTKRFTSWSILSAVSSL